MPEKTPVSHIKFERTFCMVKPDGVMRGAVGDIISRLERAGLKIVAIKMLTPTPDMVRAHYPMSDEAWVARLGDKAIGSFEHLEVTPEEILGTADRKELGQKVTESLVQYLSSGPVVAMVIEGMQALAMVRKLAGNTLPYKADVGTIRGDYSVDSPTIANFEDRSIHNLFHASENLDEAKNEIELWFGGEQIPSYQLTSEEVMYARYY